MKSKKTIKSDDDFGMGFMAMEQKKVKDAKKSQKLKKKLKKKSKESV